VSLEDFCCFRWCIFSHRLSLIHMVVLESFPQFPQETASSTYTVSVERASVESKPAVGKQAEY
jgi:hypothetical protein